jgi:hypothetical protein
VVDTLNVMPDTTPPTRRRWFQFGVVGALGATTVVAINLILGRLGDPYYFCLSVVLVIAILNLFWILKGTSQAERQHRSTFAGIHEIVFGMVSATIFAIVWVFIEDARSLMALGGAALYVFVGVATLTRRSPSIWAVVILAFGTLLLMQGSRLRLYVHGSRFDYNGFPWREWSVQALMFLVSTATVMLGRERG